MLVLGMAEVEVLVGLAGEAEVVGVVAGLAAAAVETVALLR